MSAKKERKGGMLKKAHPGDKAGSFKVRGSATSNRIRTLNTILTDPRAEIGADGGIRMTGGRSKPRQLPAGTQVPEKGFQYNDTEYAPGFKEHGQIYMTSHRKRRSM